MVMDNIELDKVLTEALVKVEGCLNMLRQPGANMIIVYEKIQGMRDKLQYILRKVRTEREELVAADEGD